MYDLLNLIKYQKIDESFKINIPYDLEIKLKNIFKDGNKYIGIAPGAGEKNKIWPLNKFIEVGKFFQKKNYKIVLYLGPSEANMTQKLKKEFPESILPEDMIKNFSNIEIVMGSTKFLSCALANDSGISHMLSTNYCPLVKLFGPKSSIKFTPQNKNLKTISSSEFNSSDVSVIPLERVIYEINSILI